MLKFYFYFYLGIINGVFLRQYIVDLVKLKDLIFFSVWIQEEVLFWIILCNL